MFTDLTEPLYAAFATVPRPTRVEGCTHCVDADDDRALLDRPLRALSAHDLSRYAARAINTWGGVEEFRYFTPRVIELASTDACFWPSLEVVCGKLAVAEWRTWPQQDALTRFMKDLWARMMVSFPTPVPIGAVLCAFGCAEVELNPLLDRWAALECEPAIRHLHEFATGELSWRHGRPQLENPFWDHGSPRYAQLVEWLTSGTVAVAVAAAYVRTQPESILTLLTEIDDALIR